MRKRKRKIATLSNFWEVIEAAKAKKEAIQQVDAEVRRKAAELEAVESSHSGVVRRAQQGLGGGTAARRMLERKRRLSQKLVDLDAEKAAVKHAADRAGFRLKEHLQKLNVGKTNK